MNGAPRSNADITAVVPCFNDGEFLETAIESLLAQRGGPPQIVVVDDGSTDPQTLAALERVGSSVQVIRQPNQGQSVARNTGIRATQTPLFITVDADDRLLPAALETMRAALEQHAELGFAYGIMRFAGDWSGEITMPSYDAYRLLYRHTIGATCLTRRALFDEVGGFDPAFRGFEDWEFWLHALACGWHGVQIPEVTLEYLRHGETTLSGARRDYHAWYRKLRAKHHGLYARRAEFAAASDLSLAGRLFYRWYWGPRPIPATLEHRLYALVFRG